MKTLALSLLLTGSAAAGAAVGLVTAHSSGSQEGPWSETNLPIVIKTDESPDHRTRFWVYVIRNAIPRSVTLFAATFNPSFPDWAPALSTNFMPADQLDQPGSDPTMSIVEAKGGPEWRMRAWPVAGAWSSVEKAEDIVMVVEPFAPTGPK